MKRAALLLTLAAALSACGSSTTGSGPQLGAEAISEDDQDEGEELTSTTVVLSPVQPPEIGAQLVGTAPPLTVTLSIQTGRAAATTGKKKASAKFTYGPSGTISGTVSVTLEGAAGAVLDTKTSALKMMAPSPKGLDRISSTKYTATGAATCAALTYTLQAPEGAYPRVLLSFNPVESLTACLDTADQPVTARRAYRVLFELALQTLRARGLPVRPDVAVFHLPSELLAAHLGISRETLWRNLKPLKLAGILDERDHYGTLRGQTSVTGKVWAISLRPEQQLSGRADRVRVKAADLKYPWRDLDADAQAGRTAYALTRTDERQAQDAAHSAERAPQRSEERARAAARKTERMHAQRAGKKPLRGRAAATANAAETRAARAALPPSPPVQQSEKRGLKLIERQEPANWALSPFLTPSHDVTLTVAPGPTSGLDAIFSVPSLAGLSRRERGAAVESTAKTLAATFEDTANLKFWCWLLWQLLRGFDQGQDWSDEVTHVLARIYHDLRHDESMNNRAAKKPGALVAAELRASGLLDALRGLAPMRVGVKPKAA